MMTHGPWFLGTEVTQNPPHSRSADRDAGPMSTSRFSWYRGRPARIWNQRQN